MNYWYMQVHPSEGPKAYGPDVMLDVIRKYHDVGMGDELQWCDAPGAEPTRKRFREIANGDVAVVAHGQEMFAVVQFVGKYESCKSLPGRWYGVHRKVRLLCDDLRPYESAYVDKYHKMPADGLPIRSTLAAIRKNEFVPWLVDQLQRGGYLADDGSDNPLPPPEKSHAETSSWKRDEKIAHRVIARQCCEICGTKATFEKPDGKRYFEAHHLIPMSKQGSFAVSLDVLANVACLCPQCHRMIHHGCEKVAKTALNVLFRNHRTPLKSACLKISESTFLKYATRHT